MRKPSKQIADTFICVICEGPEEYDYLNRLKELGVWDKRYHVDLVDAGGNGNIPARYQDKYQNGQYDIVLVFCDTDKKPHEQYLDIKNKIDFFHGEIPVSNEVVIFGNPCTMQIIISHWTEEKLKTSSKHVNADIIEKYTGIKEYDAHADQRRELMDKIDVYNYERMKINVCSLNNNDLILNSSNFDVFVANLENRSTEWIKAINDLINS